MENQLSAGLYETVLTTALLGRLSQLDQKLVYRQELRPAESADRIAQLLARQIERALAAVPERERVAVGVQVARRLLEELTAKLPRAEAIVEAPLPPGEILSAIGEWWPDGSVRTPVRPLIPLVDTTLLTNSPGEPAVGSQVRTEIASADSIDLVMAFIRKSGLLPVMPALREHCVRGRQLRVLTTTYAGSTEAAALDLLAELGAEIRISYDLSTTRLHAKAWTFHRSTAFSTAYVGSSNLTHSAQVAGIEWNLRVSAARNPDVVEKIEAVFETYWQGGDFVDYDRVAFLEAMDRERKSRSGDVSVLSPLEVRLQPFQERLLELIAVSRAQGLHRNLLVSATGTGKTVMAAVDYGRLRNTLPRARLLFVAHREEIIDQSIATFRHVLRDYTFGEKWVGGARPTAFDHVFASVQSLRPGQLAHLAPDHFDVIVVDEFHHAAAPSYGLIMNDLAPREMLGLTATPERADGLPLLHWFGDRIAAELRLWDAIEQHRLAPFAYYGVHDGIDLREVPWRRGRGYDEAALTNIYVGDGAWVRLVYQQLVAHVDDVATIRCLGFCVSVAHAKFMAEQFRKLGVEAVAVSGETSDADRRAALQNLRNGSVQVIFSVDLFNEGVDVPTVDTVLMMRPTESGTLFLQQLGRGLRLAENKSLCTVLDFVGHHRREFRFDRRYRALLGGTRRDLEKSIEDGFPFVPAGCHLELDRVAQDIVLQSVRQAVPSNWPAKVKELQSLAHGQDNVTMSDYLRETGLEVGDVYAAGHSWSALREAAGMSTLPAGPEEKALRRGIGRLQHVDDRQRLDGYSSLLRSVERPNASALSTLEQRLARMLAANMADQAVPPKASLQDALDLLWMHPQALAETRDLMEVLSNAPSHVQKPALPDVPLQVHGRYTRIEILAAVGEGESAKTPQWREGVYDAKGVSADLLAFTLDKTSGDFSPTTRYRDYAISPELIHWESQSLLRAESPTGKRYQNHASMGRKVLLFARTRQDDRAFWFLGPATYVRHEGERPMAIIWRLETPLSGDLFSAFAAAVA